MTFREKWLKDHPDDDEYMFLDTCPHKQGYEDDKCHRCSEQGFTCRDCWNREIPGTEEPSIKPDLNALIERAATKKDISVTIFITGDSTHISVYPCPDPSEKRGNPVAEAYRLLVNSSYKTTDIELAIGYLGEALE